MKIFNLLCEKSFKKKIKKINISEVSDIYNLEYKRSEERPLIGRNRTKSANHRGSPLFQATYNVKKEKHTVDSAYLVSVRCGRLAEGKGHETD